METIYDKISSLGQKEVNKIKDEQKIEIDSLKKEILTNAKNEATKIKEKADKKAKSLITQNENYRNLKLRQTKGKVYEDFLDLVFSKVLEELNKYDKTKLLNLVSTLLKKEKIKGNEIIKVNKNDYQKYLKALSTENKKKIVNLDKLNKKLGTKYKLTLSDVAATNLESGFILEGKDYDLNFDFELIVKEYKTKYQRDLIKELLKR